MYKSFTDIESLKQWVVEDKQAKGVGASTLDRYPIRFVLFDNFSECYEFVEFLQSDCGAHVESVDRWIDTNYPDIMLTYVELGERICNHIRKKSPNDCVIAPFSELARFYDNKKSKKFDSLLQSIKAKEADPRAVEQHQRVYIPIVGLEGKMEMFANDSQTIIWRLQSENNDLTYRLILTANNDYGVKGLEKNYTIINTIREWLNIWKDTKSQIRPQIICKSNSIYANAEFAQPDNAFSYEICHNAYEFLSHGLGLSFGGIQPQISDGNNWEILAGRIDLSEHFSFPKFVRSQLSIDEIRTYKDFIRLWFSHPTIFERWLLARYYASIENCNQYICQILQETTNYGTTEFIENMARTLPEDEVDIKVRYDCLQYAATNHTQLSEATESMLAKTLQTLPTQIGYEGAMRYFTGVSVKEKEIAISWLGQQHIDLSQVEPFYSDLYRYMIDGVGISIGVPGWIEDYFRSYKEAKLANKYTQDISEKINIINSDEAHFENWYNGFKSTYTILKSRKDIEVFYWVDGLGIDWIPLVKEVIAEKKEQMIFLNEILVARSLLPSKTEINKKDLQRLLPKGKTLEKCGDLDGLAHKNDNISPFTINKEIELVRKSIEEILNRYIGKKIAIISDHGLTYLSQLVQGKNLAGVESDHHGRIAIRKSVSETSDNSYYRLEDEKTLCAMKHESLCAKLPAGQGAHGGCTPEEVLVPIFIISSCPAATNWSADLLTPEINATEPRVKFVIKNIPSTNVPYVIYNGKKYKMHNVSCDIYESEDMILDAKVSDLELAIGDVTKIVKIKISTGVVEDDLFAM